ncbi:MAG: hypothetical protein SPG06_00565 [Eubacteriales bacterium]|nr:hypothetical protein [Eubacteriales bacterium]
MSSFGRLNNDKLQSISPAVAGENFGSKSEAKQKAYEQSVAHYTSQTKFSVLCEAVCPLKIKVGRHSLLPLCPTANENYN